MLKINYKYYDQRPSQGGRRRGFTLLEIAMVIVIIGLLYGAVSTGGDLLHSMRNQRILSDFVLGWSNAFNDYVRKTGVVPGDNPAAPTNTIPAGLCGDALANTFLSAGVSIPDALADQFTERVYQDSQGNSHRMNVCMATVSWNVPDIAVGTYRVDTRHVLVVNGITNELAREMDTIIDGYESANRGLFRSQGDAGSTAGVSTPWLLNPDGESWLLETVAFFNMGN